MCTIRNWPTASKKFYFCMFFIRTHSTYYPKLPELEDSNVETKINRISDYFGSQDHVWLYRTIFPPIFDTLMDLYRESVREKEETFAGFRQRMMEEYHDGRGLAVRFGFGE